MTKIKKYFLKIFYDKGIWLTLLLSIFVLIVFFGEILKNPNQVYFSNSGDGLQSYYTTIYHIKYDSTYSHFQGMNYPYGEHILFTNCQPVISNTLKFISQNIIDVSDYAIGVINLMMLFSIVIAAIFLYLILREFNLNWIYSIFVAIGISYLSPLVNRFPGHYSLSYVSTIPIILYLLIKFYKNPSWIISLITGLFILIMTTFHMYNFAFAAFILGIFWIIQLISDKNYRKWKFSLINIFLQIILPILIINIWLLITDTVSDRTSYPWGFVAYKSSWVGIFLPQPFIKLSFLESFLYTPSSSWEGLSYIGHVSTFYYIFIFTFWSCIPFFSPKNIVFFLSILIIGFVIYFLTKRKKNFLILSQNKFINIILWIGFISLPLSFAWPFSYFPELIYFAGPLKQFRGIGRFAWIFYFTINIATFYIIYNLKYFRKNINIVIMIIAILVLYIDAYSNIKNVPQYITNKVPELSNSSEKVAFDSIIDTIDISKYQSIIPIPFFHVGSENFWLTSYGKSDYYSIIFSLKTGLPLNAVMMSRTSISQSINNIALVLEPYKKLKVIEDCKSPNSFLLLVAECSEIKSSEKELINKATFIVKNNFFSLYEISPSIIQQTSDSTYIKVKNELASEKLFSFNNYYSTDSINRFLSLDFNDKISSYSYEGKGCYTGNIKKYNRIFEGNIPNIIPDSEFVFSFWFGKIDQDLFPRTTVEVAYADSLGNIIRADSCAINRLIKTINNDWALTEFRFKMKSEEKKLLVTIWNNDLKNKDTLFIDEILIRPFYTNIYKINKEKSIIKNNREYIKE